MENLLITKYQEYIAFLNDNQEELLCNNNWDILFRKLQLLKLSSEYTLDDFRSKKNTNSILSLYARRVGTQRPTEEMLEKYDYLSDMSAYFRRILSGIKDDDDTLDMSEKMSPESVVTLDFTVEAVWEAYLLLTSNYYIGQRWHGGYHRMTIPANLEEVKAFKPWREDEIPKYEKFLEETNFDFEPKIILSGSVASIKHIGIFFHNRISQCHSKIFYNKETRQIENFEFSSSELFKFSQRFYY